jgi:hypothetical protein
VTKTWGIRSYIAYHAGVVRLSLFVQSRRAQSAVAAVNPLLAGSELAPRENFDLVPAHVVANVASGPLDSDLRLGLTRVQIVFPIQLKF